MGTDTTRVYDEIAHDFATRHWSTRLIDQMQVFTSTLPAGSCVLDAGCGPGRDSEWLRELGHQPLGVDASLGMLQEAQSRVAGVTFLAADLRSLPLRDRAFDGVWMCASLLHLPKHEARLGLSEAVRVSKLGAPIYVGVQLGIGEETRHDGRFFAYWTEAELASVARAVGYDVELITTFAGSPVSWLALHGRRVRD